MEHERETRNTCAPEITYDEMNKEYMIYWVSTILGQFLETQTNEYSGYNHRICYTITKDFTTYLPTKLLYDPSFNVIDATILKADKSYVFKR